MEQFQTITQKIDNLKKPIVTIALIGLFAHLLIVVGAIVLNNNTNKALLSPMFICHKGADEFFSNSPSKNFFKKSFFKEKTDFKIDRIILVKFLNSYSCDLVIKDSKGHRSYLVKLEKNLKYPHHYKISKIIGQKLVSTYQIKGNI